MAEVFTGFEGIVTPDILAETRRLERQKARTLRQAQKSGQRLFAAEAGAFAGQALGDALRRLAPGTFDRRGERAREAQNVIRTARERVADASSTGEESAEGLVGQRLRAVREARQIARARGLDSLADQLAGNELQLANQVAEMRKLSAQTRRTEVDIEATEQSIGLKALGDPDTIQRIEGDDTIFDAQILPGGNALFTNKDGSLELLRPGEYRSAELTGKPEDFEVDKTAQRKAVDQMSAGFAMTDALLALRKQIVQNPDVATVQVGLSARLGDLADEARAVVKDKFGPNRVSEGEAMLSAFFQREQIQDRVFQARVSNLAFLIAATRENGRFTDRDIQQAAITLGSGPDPEARIAAMDDLFLSTQERLTFQANSVFGEKGHPALDGLQNKFGQYHEARSEFFVPVPGRDPEPGTGGAGSGDTVEDGGALLNPNDLSEADQEFLDQF